MSKYTDKFDALATGYNDFRSTMERILSGVRAKDEARWDRFNKNRKRRRRQGKVARRARRYNRRPSKRPKGRRKP